MIAHVAIGLLRQYLRPTARVHGVTIQGGTDPAKAITVQAFPGQFTVGGLAAGTYDVQVKLAGYVTRRVMVWLIESRSPASTAGS